MLSNRYLMSMKSRDEVESYLKSLLGETTPEFMREFLLRWSSVSDEYQDSGEGEIIVKHKKPSEDQLALFPSSKKSKKTKKVIENVARKLIF